MLIIAPSLSRIRPLGKQPSAAALVQEAAHDRRLLAVFSAHEISSMLPQAPTKYR